MCCMTDYEVLWVAPSFDVFYRTHRQYVRAIGVRAGVPREHLDDVVSEVFARIWEINMLSSYDPRRAPFSQWVGAYVGLKMLGQRDRVLSRRREIPFGLNLEHLLPPAGDDWTEVAETITDLHAAAKRWRGAEPTIYATWQAVRACVQRTGGLAVVDLADTMASSATGAHQRLWRLREAACAVAGVPIPQRRAHTVG